MKPTLGFKIVTCAECRFCFPTDDPLVNDCRISPPEPLGPYSSEYRKVRPTTPACADGMPKAKAPAKKKETKWKTPTTI